MRSPISSRTERTISTASAATRSPLPTPGTTAIPVSPGSVCRAKGRTPTATSRTSIISPTAMRRWRGSWCARSSRPRPPATRWKTSSPRVSTIRRSTGRATHVRIRLSSTCIHVHDTPNGAEVAYVTARQGAPRCRPARDSRRLQYDDPLHHARTARAAAAGAVAERQGAARLHQRADPQLAGLAQSQGRRHLGADVVSFGGEAGLSGQPRRLPLPARPVASR